MGRREKLGHPLGRKIILWFLWSATKLLLRLEIEGLRNLPRSGPLIIIINHIAFLDPLVCGRLPRLIIPLAKTEAFDNLFFRFIMKTYGTISVTRGEADLKAMKAALGVLKEQGAILLAPEGTRSPTHQLQPAKEGAIRLALRSGAPITPIGITGTHQLTGAWKKLKRAPVRLSIGPPFYLRPRSKNGRAGRAETTVMVRETMGRLARQLPPAYRGVYHDLDQAPEVYVIPARGSEQ